MVLRACSLRDADVIFVQIGSVQLININVLDCAEKNAKNQNGDKKCCLQETQPAQQNTGS